MSKKETKKQNKKEEERNLTTIEQIFCPVIAIALFVLMITIIQSPGMVRKYYPDAEYIMIGEQKVITNPGEPKISYNTAIGSVASASLSLLGSIGLFAYLRKEEELSEKKKAKKEEQEQTKEIEKEDNNEKGE